MVTALKRTDKSWINENNAGGIIQLSTNSIPMSEESEAAVIGACLVDSLAFVNVAVFLQAEDFFLLRHTYIWRALERLDEAGQPVDIVTVTDKLKEVGRLDEVGGAAYVMSLINQTPDSTNAETYGRIVERAAIRRRIMAAADEIKATAAGLKGDLTLEEVKATSEAVLFDATARGSQNEPETARQVVSQYFSELEGRHENKKAGQFTSVPTGLRSFDEKWGGFQKGEFVILGGESGHGKSALALSIALYQAQLNLRVGIFSNEMSKAQYMARLMAMLSGVHLSSLRAGDVGASWSELTNAMETISHLPLHFDFTPGLKPIQLQRKIRKLQIEHGLDFVIVDGIWRMEGDREFADSKGAKFEHISGRLSDMAKEFNVPIMGLHQINSVDNRQDKRPFMADLRGSQKLRFDASVIMFIYREHKYNASIPPNNAELIVRKGRDMGEGTIDLWFEPTLTKFSDAKKTAHSLRPGREGGLT